MHMYTGSYTLVFTCFMNPASGALGKNVVHVFTVMNMNSSRRKTVEKTVFLFEKLKRKIFRSSPLCRHFQSNDFLLSTSQLILILRGIRAEHILIRER